MAKRKAKAKALTGEAIAEQAKTWIGTPYHHQASVKGAGADCLGLIRGLWRECLGREPEDAPPYTRDWAEPSGEEVLMQAALRHLEPVEGVAAAQPGDILIFRMNDHGIAKHLGVYCRSGENPSFVHAYEKHGVVESALSAPWARRIAGVFRFPLKKE
jgi:NlpC/P60 family putative phage cell wall peptidase